ncbi:adapter molecule Crk-like, partial [Centruroides sculpturatus]|uniref:adapter molecule Crk-like n=1 Tax=Centruroides sculpturatus TaxID=218467 RepID=UPI000C6CC243
FINTLINCNKIYKYYLKLFNSLIKLSFQLERKIEKVRAKYDFEGSGDPDDLPFKKGEILSIITKDEEQWWTGRNHLGQTGSIPVPYVEKIDDCEENECFIAEQPLEDQLTQVPPPPPEQTSEKLEPFKQTMPNFQRKLPALARVKQARVPNAYDKTALKLERKLPALARVKQARVPNAYDKTALKLEFQRKLPALARVKQARVPNAYDKTALKLEVGDIIKVTKTNINGQWEGELWGRVGHFPFTHVEFIDSDNPEESTEC